MIEYEVDFFGGLRQRAGVRVDGALGPAGGARCIEQQRRRFRIERQGFAPLRLARHEIVPPDIPAGGPWDVAALVAEDDHLFHRAPLRQRLIGFGLQRAPPPAPLRKIGGEQHLGARILKTHRGGAISETGKDRHRDQAQLETCVQDYDHLRHHGHIQRDALAGGQAEAAQRVCQPVRFALQFGESQHADGAVFALPDDRFRIAGGVTGAINVAVQAVPCNIELSAREPAGPLHAARSIQHLGVRFEPLDPEILHHLIPKLFRVLLRIPYKFRMRAESQALHKAVYVGIARSTRGRVSRCSRWTYAIQHSVCAAKCQWVHIITRYSRPDAVFCIIKTQK